MSDSNGISGKALATWENPYLPRIGDRDLTAGSALGDFRTKGLALQAALDHEGAEVLVENGDGFSLYALAGGGAEFTRANLEQAEGYPVSNVTALEGGEPSRAVLITADDFEMLPPAVHNNPYSGDHYLFANSWRLSPLLLGSYDELRGKLEGNTTSGLSSEKLTSDRVREALGPTLQILDIYDPRAADWVRGMGRDEFILTDSRDLIVAYPPFYYSDSLGLVVDDLVIADDFWCYNDVEKASLLYHEFIHSRQGAVAAAYEWWKTYLNGSDTYETAVEDEAYLAQHKMLKHFGIDSGEISRDVRFYLKQRELL